MDVNQLSFEELLEKYEPIIKKQIKKLRMYGYYDELYQVGAIALWQAKMNFDPSKGNFTIFSQRYIRGKMLNFFQRELRHNEHYLTGLKPELFENMASEGEHSAPALPVERITPYLSKAELIWFTEFYENNKELMEIAKQYKVSVNTVKTWRMRAIEKIRTIIMGSEWEDLLRE